MTKYYHRPLSREDEAGILILNQRFSQLDKAIVSFVAQTSNRLSAVAGENIADRDAVYLQLSDNKIYRMDADVSSPVVGAIRGFAAGAVSSGGTATMVLKGTLNGFSSLTPWQPVYVGTTAGSITQTRPSPNLGGSQIFIAEMGFAVAADTIFVNPKPIQFSKRGAMALNDTLTIQHGSDANGYKRKLLAYYTETVTGSVLATYASSNQDADVFLQGPSGAGGTLTITASGSSQIIGNSGGSQIWQAQSFIPNVGTLDEITVTLSSNFNSPTGDITWELRTDNAGVPSATVLASGTFTPVPSSTNTISVTGVNRIFLGSSTYWLVLRAASQSLDNGYRIQISTANPYADGMRASSSNGGSSWTTSSTHDCQISIKTLSVPGYQKLAQGFQSGSAADVGVVDLWLKKVGSPTGNLTAKIYSDSGGNPNTLLGTSTNVAASSLGTSYGTISFAFASPVNVSTSTQYHLVLETSDSQSNSNYVVSGADASSPGYANGQLRGYDGASWSGLTMDAIFEVRTTTFYHPQKLKVDRWSGSHADMVNRYGDSAGASAETKTTFKCTKAAGFADVTVAVEL